MTKGSIAKDEYFPEACILSNIANKSWTLKEARYSLASNDFSSNPSRFLSSKLSMAALS
jgi:hypothetical protein